MQIISVRVLTHSRSNAQLVFPGKKVMAAFNDLWVWDAKSTFSDLLKDFIVLENSLDIKSVWFSWTHLDNLVNLIYEHLHNRSYKGIINGTAPNPVRLSEMCDQLGEVMGRPSWLPVPDFVLKAVLGEGFGRIEALPIKAKELGFSFRYPYVKDALKAIVSSKK